MSSWQPGQQQPGQYQAYPGSTQPPGQHYAQGPPGSQVSKLFAPGDRLLLMATLIARVTSASSFAFVFCLLLCLHTLSLCLLSVPVHLSLVVLISVAFARHRNRHHDSTV